MWGPQPRPCWQEAGGTCASVWTIQPLLVCLPSLDTLRRPRIQNCSTESKTHHEAFLGADNVNWVYRSGCTINLTREQGNGPALCEGLVSFVIGLFSLLTGWNIIPIKIWADYIILLLIMKISLVYHNRRWPSALTKNKFTNGIVRASAGKTYRSIQHTVTVLTQRPCSNLLCFMIVRSVPHLLQLVVVPAPR